MVRVFYNRQFTNYSLEDIKQMTGTDVIIAVTKDDIKKNSHLTRLGRKIPLDKPLAEVQIYENDCLRIVEPDMGPAVTGQIEDVTRLIDECKATCKAMHTRHGGRALKSLMEFVTTDDFVEKVSKAIPSVLESHSILGFLSDPWNIFTASQNIEECHYLTAEFPIFVKALHFIIKEAAKAKPGMNNMNLRPLVGNNPVVNPAAPSTSGQDITADMLQQAIRMAMGGVAPAAAAPRPAAPIVNADPLAELRSRYSSQLAQLHEFGFTEDAQNLPVLESVGGNVESALELLITIREDGM